MTIAIDGKFFLITYDNGDEEYIKVVECQTNENKSIDTLTIRIEPNRSINLKLSDFSQFATLTEMKTFVQDEIDTQVTELVSGGAADPNSHVQNTDTALATGTGNEVSAAELRALLDAPASGFVVGNVVTVGKSGCDFTTINEAVSSIVGNSQFNPFLVRVFSGLYLEPPIAIGSGIHVDLSPATLVAPSDANNPIFSFTGNNSGIRGGGVISLPSNSYGISVSGVNNTIPIRSINFTGSGSAVLIKEQARAVVEGCQMFSGVSTGVKGESSARCDIANVISFADTAFHFDNCEFWIQNCGVENATNGLYINNGATGKAGALTFETCDIAIRTGLLGTNTVDITEGTSKNTGVFDIQQENSESIINLVNGIISLKKLDIVNWDNITLEFTKEDSLSEPQKVLTKELSVGFIEKPVESSFGEGDSTDFGLLCYTKDAVDNFTDKSDEATSKNNSTFTFVSNTTGNAIYISLDRIKPNGDYYPFEGLKAKMDSIGVIGAGSLLMQYWNGASWVTFNVMSTNSEAPYETFANSPFVNVITPESEHVYFNRDIVPDWVKNDEPNTGIDRYWVRIFIQSSITTVPVFEHFKCHASHKEINPTGWPQYQGQARPVRQLFWKYSDAQVFGGNNPQNSDFFLSDNLGFGAIENRFQNNALDIVGFRTFMPSDLDTSTPVKLKLYCMTPSADLTGSCDITIRYGWVNATEFRDIFTSTGAAPTIGANEQQIFTQISFTETNKFFEFIYNIDVSELKPRKVDGSPTDIFVISIQRDGSADSFNGDFVMFEIIGDYTAWNDGGFPIVLDKVVDLFEDWESGTFVTNSWQLATSNNANEWVVGTADPFSGTRSAYISNDGGISTSYDASSPDNINHLYIDVPIPVGAKSPKVTFNFKGLGETSFDFMEVFAATTAVTPVSDTAIDPQWKVGEDEYNNEVNFNSFIFDISPSFVGNTVRIIFSFTSDISITGSSGAIIDNIEVSHFE